MVPDVAAVPALPLALHLRAPAAGGQLFYWGGGSCVPKGTAVLSEDVSCSIGGRGRQLFCQEGAICFYQRVGSSSTKGLYADLLGAGGRGDGSSTVYKR